jgi:hypothetical protein
VNKIDLLDMSAQQKGSLALTVLRRKEANHISTPNNKSIILTHIPRTAGVTLDAILLGIAHYLKRSWVRLPGDAYSQYWGHPKANVLDSVIELGSRVHDAYLISGHMPFGIHEKLALDPIYITVLRDPIERSWSQVRRIARDDQGLSDARIIELINTGGLVDNLQVRMISGCLDKSEPCDNEMLERAKSNLLNYYALVGFTDNFNVFLASLLLGLDWPNLMFRARNISEKLEKNPPDLIYKALIMHNRYDFLLVDYAKTIVSQKSAKFTAQNASRVQEKSSKSEDTLFSLEPFTLFGQSVGILKKDHLVSLEIELLSAGISLDKIAI